ncbi:hypothetical protein [Streptomyces xanthochromogenes]|uniref:hypothetical protein n=1 Tax=Streptomyces xanthochromogenes TaxID=67384 RepID=UPI00341F244B
MAIPKILDERDRDKIRAMGKAGWEALLRTQGPGQYQDPFGNGTTCYRRTDGTNLCIDAMPTCNPSDLAPDGSLYWDQHSEQALHFHKVYLDYLLDENAPRSKAGTV